MRAAVNLIFFEEIVMEKKVSQAEIEKEKSLYLRGTIREQLAQDTSRFDDSVKNTLKFHGMYQQDDRDMRQALTREGKEKHYMFMIRTKIPGGRVTADQYLKMDELADRFGHESLRITTRQGIQFHGVIKKNLKATMSALNQQLITTLGACGDVERNVVTCPAPFKDRNKARIQEYASVISDAFLGDNCVDIYAHDIGLVAVIGQDGDLSGFNVLVGGGLAMTHNKPETHPILAKPLGYVDKERILPVVEGIIKVQRDYGNRENRMRGRMKYLIEERGIEWFYGEVKRHIEFDLEPVREMLWEETLKKLVTVNGGTNNG